MRAALDLAPQHAGHHHVGAEIGAPGDLVDPIRTNGTGPYNLLQFLRHIRHTKPTPLLSSSPRKRGPRGGRRSAALDSRFRGNDGVTVPYSAAARIGSDASRAARSLGGDIGRSRSRIPVASAIAFATA